MFAVRSSRPATLYRLRAQLGGGLLVAAVLPYLTRVATMPSYNFLPQLNVTFLGIMVAIVAGTWLFRSLTTYPGVETSAYILPAFSATFGALVMFFVFTRVEYNRYLLLSGYVLSLIWFGMVVVLVQRRQRFRIGVLPIGKSIDLPASSNVEWVPIDEHLIEVGGLDALTVDLRTDMPDIWERRLADYALAGIPVYHSKHLVESLTGRVELEHLSETSFGSLTPMSAWMSIKHALDWMLALAAGVILFPILLLIALAIRLTSPGPALFRQTRIGYQGRRFTIYKFRSMRVADPKPEEARNHAITRASDSRITPFGRFLRTSRIDELPQLINVLRGEMSWIGPRPEAEVLSRWYEAEIPFYHYRHIVRPGIAGWAQVSQGHVAEVAEVRDKLFYDFYYIKNYSVWMDLLILVRTIRTMLTGFGSR